MKTFIISDIDSHSESIIPYGLNMGKYTETEVEILHIIDPRKKQGVSSPYADSRTVSPGNKLSHKRILQREENKASFALEKLLSAEASRLNYPLKINVEVKSDGVEKGISSAVDTDPEPLLVASLDPVNSMITSLDELITIVGKVDSPGLFVPPAYKFRQPGNILIFTDFDDAAYEHLRDVMKWLHPFSPMINALGMAKKKDFMDMELKSSAWKKVVEKFLEPTLTLKTTIINKDGEKDPLLDYIQRNDPELVLLPKRLLASGLKKIIKPGKQGKILKSFGKPVMIY